MLATINYLPITEEKKDFGTNHSEYTFLSTLRGTPRNKPLSTHFYVLNIYAVQKVLRGQTENKGFLYAESPRVRLAPPRKITKSGIT